MQRGKEAAWFGDGVLHMRVCVCVCVCVKIVEQQAICKTRRVVACYKEPW